MPPVPADAALRDRIHTTWNELADFDLADADAALVHALGAFSDLVRAPAATWSAAVRLTRTGRGPLGGWRIRARLSVKRTRREQPWRRKPAEADAALIGGALRATSARGDAVCMARMHARAIAVAFRVNADAASTFLWEAPPGRAFTPADRDRLAYAVRGLKWFHRQALVSHGLLVAQAPLTTAERAVLARLLEPLPEPAIAERLGLPPATVHQHVFALTRKIGVSGPFDLIELWRGRG